MLSPDRQTDQTACAFLALILPEQGPYAAFIVETASKRKYVVFASTIAELWEIIKAADAAGHTAYHACAAYKEARRDPRNTPRGQRRYGRTKHNVRGAKAFWFELDAGPGKPYPDWKAATRAVAEFCRATGLPRPLIVLSGFGIHVYWPLLQALDPEVWERYAVGLKALCVRHGLQADPARTSDIASVLRTPGTHHRKAGVRLVQCGGLEGPYSLELFEFLLSASDTRKALKASTRAAQRPPYLRDTIGESVTDKALRGLSTLFEPSFSAPIVKNCEQVRALRDSKGNLPEPLWYSGLGVLAYAVDGDALAHEWSSGDSRYTEGETQERLDRARQLSGATTCRRFHELNPEVCERCPLWEKIKSPIVLGRKDGVVENNHDTAASREGSDKTALNPSGNGNGASREGVDKTAQQSNARGSTGQAEFPLRWHGEEDPNSKRKWLVKHLLLTTGVGLISGQWGTAKTFVAIDLSISVMTGTPFAGRSVKRKGGVLFIAAEGASEIPIRVSGLIETKLPDHKGKLPFAWSENCPMLTDKGAIEELARIAREAADRMRAEFGVELVLIIIDTMSAAAGFKDENASSEGQVAMNVLNDFSKRTGALVLACDHFGKAIETGTRGTSAKEASADVIIACLGEKTQAGSVTNLRIAVRKLRGGATGAETAFRLRTIDMGVDEDGDPITTCVIEWSQVTVAPPPEAAKGKGWPKTTLFRAALVTTLGLHGTEQQAPVGGSRVFAVELDRVREEFDKLYPLDSGDRQKQLGKRRQAFKRSMDSAQSNGLVGGREIDGKFMVWLTRPEDEGVRPPSSSSRQQAA